MNEDEAVFEPLARLGRHAEIHAAELHVRLQLPDQRAQHPESEDARTDDERLVLGGGDLAHCQRHARVRHVDDEIAHDAGLAREPAALGKAAQLVIALLDLGELGDMGGARDDAMLGELALADIDLAAAADGPSATDGIDVDAQRAGSLEDGRSGGKAAALARRREDDEGVGLAHLRRLRSSRAARRAAISSAEEPGSPSTTAFVTAGAGAISRNLFVQNLQCLSVPFRTLAP